MFSLYCFYFPPLFLSLSLKSLNLHPLKSAATTFSLSSSVSSILLQTPLLLSLHILSLNRWLFLKLLHYPFSHSEDGVRESDWGRERDGERSSDSFSVVQIQFRIKGCTNWIFATDFAPSLLCFLPSLFSSHPYCFSVSIYLSSFNLFLWFFLCSVSYPLAFSSFSSLFLLMVWILASVVDKTEARVCNLHTDNVSIYLYIQRGCLSLPYIEDVSLSP